MDFGWFVLTISSFKLRIFTLSSLLDLFSPISDFVLGDLLGRCHTVGFFQLKMSVIFNFQLSYFWAHLSGQCLEGHAHREQVPALEKVHRLEGLLVDHSQFAGAAHKAIDVLQTTAK